MPVYTWCACYINNEIVMIFHTVSIRDHGGSIRSISPSRFGFVTSSNDVNIHSTLPSLTHVNSL